MKCNEKRNANVRWKIHKLLTFWKFLIERPNFTSPYFEKPYITTASIPRITDLRKPFSDQIGAFFG